jgi:hypothetical protein
MATYKLELTREDDGEVVIKREHLPERVKATLCAQIPALDMLIAHTKLVSPTSEETTERITVPPAKTK